MRISKNDRALEPVAPNDNRSLEPLSYSVAEACRVSSLGRSNLYRFIREGKLEARKLGGRTLVPAAALRRLIEEAPAA
ncbi:helix-turn-helix domain-containing protein [Mesorhizobium sp. L2C085B000]|uniref:helix-turn-helix domain-containing protein n=1 Tax=Mesorhizobium sp. L2C085B000 TaxID=1287117 RepID=UPI0009DED05B|nr:helix-turn-helix domain-containing protein [Mesorhizobium sp. L2C085B000]